MVFEEKAIRGLSVIISLYNRG